jgi:putative peptide zinc metalloprotease protein
MACYMIAGGMDGTRDVDQLWREAAIRLGQDAPSQDELIRLLAQLYSADLLQCDVTPNSAELLDRAAKMDRSRWLGRVLNPLAVRIRFWYPDPFFERTLPLVGWSIGWPGVILWSMAVLPAIVLGAQHWQELSENAADRILAADNIAAMALSFILLKILHELGHGFTLKRFGGTVHEIGVMFLTFAPMPYVDASAASEFRSKWQRILVGAAGMIVEVFIAALAFYVWLAIEQGLVRALAYNVIVAAGVSTILFNGNPLLRYDGYYILSDFLEIPNLAQRATLYWRYLTERYAFRAEPPPEFAATPGERTWLFLFAPASFIYRIVVILAIGLFIASEYLAVGVAIALWGLLTGIALPIGKGLWSVFVSPRLQRTRARAVATTCGFILITSIALFLVPAPLYTTTEGVVWLPESAYVRAGTDGFVRRLLVEPGRVVSIGEALIESEELTLSAELTYLRARVAELESRLASERFTERARAEITRIELGNAQAELATQNNRAERLITRSRADGTFALARPQDLPGRFVREGEQIGYVLPASSRIVRATIRQDDIDLVRTRLSRTTVRLAERLDETRPAHIIREVPASGGELPSRALGGGGGGALPVDPNDPRGTKSLERIFQVDIELPPNVASATAFGSRVYVRLDHQWEPVGLQIWRRIRQLMLARLQA